MLIGWAQTHPLFNSLKLYTMVVYGLDDKVIEKNHKELIELHKRVITNYLMYRYSMKLSKRKKFFILYDHYINTDNIRSYFYRPIRLFCYALVTNRLSEISDYIPVSKPKRKRRKK